MKFILTLVLASSLLLGGLWSMDNFTFIQPQPSVVSVAAPQASPPQVLAVTAKTYSEPTRLIISKIKVDALVESVGIDSSDRMDVPKGADNAAWFNLGVKPGELGNAVLAGHLDKVTGAPAVFYDLSKLEIGDEIISVDKDGNEVKFKVTEKQVYKYNEVPLDYAFGTSDKRRLNLITCNGSWNTGTDNYSHRLVVYSEMVND